MSILELNDHTEMFLKNYSLRRNQLIEQEVKTFTIMAFPCPQDTSCLIWHSRPSSLRPCCLSSTFPQLLHQEPSTVRSLTCCCFHPCLEGTLFDLSKYYFTPYANCSLSPLKPSHTHLDLLPFSEFRHLLICMVYFPNVIYLIMTLFCLIINFSYI